MNKIKSIIWCLPEIMLSLKQKIKLIHFQKEWRMLNQHNGTIALNIFPTTKIEVGEYTYGGIRYLTFDNDDEHLKIGNCCSIAEDVVFIGGGEHNYKRAFLFPVYSHIYGKEPLEKTPSRGPIQIEDDVWIGFGTIILSGCKIGKGSVIGAGSVVSTDVPPYSIYVGNRIIGSRFEEPQIKDFLMNVNVENIVSITNEEDRKLIASTTMNEETSGRIKEILL